MGLSFQIQMPTTQALKFNYMNATLQDHVYDQDA